MELKWLLLTIALCMALASVPSIQRIFAQATRRKKQRAADGLTVELSQGETYYKWFGPPEGQVIVLVPGVVTPCHAYTPFCEALAKEGYRVLTYDHYGRGFSDYVEGPQPRAFFLTQLQELLASEGVVEDIVLIGHSVGGCVATAFAAAHPSRIDRLVLMSTLGLHEPRTPVAAFGSSKNALHRLWQTMSFAYVARRLMRRTPDDQRPPKQVIEARRAQMSRRGFFPSLLEALRGLISEDFAADHAKLYDQNVPIVAIWGENDTIVPQAARQRLSEINPVAEQIVLPNRKHDIPFLEPRALARIVIRTLDP